MDYHVSRATQYQNWFNNNGNNVVVNNARLLNDSLRRNNYINNMSHHMNNWSVPIQEHDMNWRLNQDHRVSHPLLDDVSMISNSMSTLELSGSNSNHSLDWNHTNNSSHGIKAQPFVSKLNKWQ